MSCMEMLIPMCAASSLTLTDVGQQNTKQAPEVKSLVRKYKFQLGCSVCCPVESTTPQPWP